MTSTSLADANTSADTEGSPSATCSGGRKDTDSPIDFDGRPDVEQSSEIDEIGIVLGIEQHVLGSQVAMGDASNMRGREALATCSTMRAARLRSIGPESNTSRRLPRSKRGITRNARPGSRQKS